MEDAQDSQNAEDAKDRGVTAALSKPSSRIGQCEAAPHGSSSQIQHLVRDGDSTSTPTCIAKQSSTLISADFRAPSKPPPPIARPHPASNPPTMPTPESASFKAAKPTVPPTFDGVDYDDNKALKAAQDSIIREQWVQSMMARLIREEMGKCYYREGVNHLEKCGKLRGELDEIFEMV